MRLAQPFRAWQLAFTIATIAIPATATAQLVDSVTRVQALESSDFPRGVALVGDLPPGLTEANWHSGFATAASAWSDVTCSTAELVWAGRFASLGALPANTTPVAFVDSRSERCFVIPDNIGWTLFSPCDDWPPTTVLLNASDFNWAASPAPYEPSDEKIIDLSSALTHELGHVLGLHHQDVTDPLATMAPRYLQDGGLASLSAQDKLVLCALYPGGVSECQTDGDCDGATCEGDGERAVCEEPRAGLGDDCDLANLNCEAESAEVESRCYITSRPAPYAGYCTAECNDDGGCPADMFCDAELQECRFPLMTYTVGGGGGCSTASGLKDTNSAWPVVAILVGVTRRRRSKAEPQGP